MGIAATAAGCSSTTVSATAPPASPHTLNGTSCSARPGWTGLTLADTSPTPVVTASPGAHIVVTVPSWGYGTATDVNVFHGGILREECTVLRPDRGRRTIFLAVTSGSAQLGAGEEPASDLDMPAWLGQVTVRGAPG